MSSKTTKQIRKCISLTSAINTKLAALSAQYDGNVSMTIRFLVEKAWNELKEKR